MDLSKEYKKFKWFYTSSEKLVIAGKSASQNDELLHSLKNLNTEYIIMHTSEPGSPFSVILSDIKKVSKEDIAETAIFTGCFSRAWRSGKKETQVDIFKTSQIYKKTGMKTGTWGVLTRIERKNVSLKLALTKQKGTLRAVPEISIKSKKNILLNVVPGKTDKQLMLKELKEKLKNKFSDEEILQALPAGGLSIK